MYRNLKRTMFVAPVVGAALALGACNPAIEQAAVNAINGICMGVAIGTTVVVDVASSTSPAAVISQTIANDASKVCPVLTAGVQALIAGITAGGATATVTASTVSPSGVRHMLGRAQVGPGGQFVWVIPPRGVAGVDVFKGRF